METAIRDGHQSLLATRMRTEDMIPALERMDAIGYHSIECWGGATFDTCMRFLKEDPWERLRAAQGAAQAHAHSDAAARPERRRLPPLRRRCGARVLRPGRRERHGHLPHLRCPQRHAEPGDRVRRREARRAATSRARSATPSAPCTQSTSSRRMADRMVDMGADSLCIKDMAGLLSPMMAKALVSRIKKDHPEKLLQMHCHDTWATPRWPTSWACSRART